MGPAQVDVLSSRAQLKGEVTVLTDIEALRERFSACAMRDAF